MFSLHYGLAPTSAAHGLQPRRWPEDVKAEFSHLFGLHGLVRCCRISLCCEVAEISIKQTLQKSNLHHFRPVVLLMENTPNSSYLLLSICLCASVLLPSTPLVPESVTSQLFHLLTLRNHFAEQTSKQLLSSHSCWAKPWASTLCEHMGSPATTGLWYREMGHPAGSGHPTLRLSVIPTYLATNMHLILFSHYGKRRCFIYTEMAIL